MKQESYKLLIDLIMSEAAVYGNRIFTWDELITAMGTLGELNPEHYPYEQMEKLTQAKFEHEAEMEDQANDPHQEPTWFSKYDKETRESDEK